MGNLVQNRDGSYRVAKAALFRMLHGPEETATPQGYEIHADPVLRFHQSRARIRIVSAPARTSKSLSAAYEALERAMPSFRDDAKGKPHPVGSRLLWIVMPHYGLHKEFDYLWREIVDWKCFSPFGTKVVEKAYSPNQGNLRIKILWGKDPEGYPVYTTIDGKSATNPESLQGEQVHFAIVAETGEIDERIWDRYLATRCDEVVWPTTPKASAAWIRRFIDFAEQHPGADVDPIQYTPHCNPHFDWENFWREHARAESRVLDRIETEPHGHDCFDPATDCKALKDDYFGEQFGGLWTYESNRVLPFRDAGERSHVLQDLPPWFAGARRYIAVDYGYADAAVALWGAVGSDGTVVLYRELYEQKMASWDFAKRIRELSENARERIEWVVGDPQAPQMNEMLRRHGLPVWGEREKAATRDRQAGHARIVDLLSTDPVLKRPMLFVHQNLTRTIREWRSLRRKEGIDADVWEERAIVGADHAYDACRYLLMSLPRTDPALEGEAAMRTYLRWLRKPSGRPAERALAGPAAVGAP